MSSSPKIPIQNIYYLLCYAWNKLEERDIVDVSGIDATKILDLFAKVLIGGLSHLFKQGLDRAYVSYSEDTRCLKGKICFSPTVKQNLLIKAKAYCDFDEMSYDVVHNQILKASIRLLISEESLNQELKNQLIGLNRRLHEIKDIKLSSKIFSLVQLHRNNSFYDFLLKICHLVYDNLLVSEEPGKSKFRDFLQDERQMAYLFEEFVRNFYKIEARKCKVSREDIVWWAKPLDEISGKFLPKMVTDISIERDNSKVVIDTKYYKDALVTSYN
jgi:5-methylcytosine-specific restriction enzyme subunit McrC